MPINIQYILNSNIYLKKFLRENSFYYKDLLRNPEFIHELNNLMQKTYKLTLPDRLERIKDNINLINTFMGIIE